MLTADMVRARQQGGQLKLLRLDGPARARGLQFATHYVAAAHACVGRTRQELQQTCQIVPVMARDRRMAAGLAKLVQDRCTFEEDPGVDVQALRRALFSRASRHRQQLADEQHFDRTALLSQIAAEHELDPEELERLLYADLRAAQRVLAFLPIEPEALLDHYVEAQAQAVLLRATRVVIDVRCADPAAYRRLFHQIKFHRLLYTLEARADAGYRIILDGPYSLFRSTSRYGLQLALMLPHVRSCVRWSLQAQILWKTGRRALTFTLEGESPASDSPADPAAPSGPVAALLRQFASRSTPWQARPAQRILSLPGVGVCVPDVLFEHQPTGSQAYLEVLGFWSRDAVWKRVQLVERGLTDPIIFAVSERLRVSERALDNESRAALYVYKGVMLPQAIEAKLDKLAKAARTAR